MGGPKRHIQPERYAPLCLKALEIYKHIQCIKYKANNIKWFNYLCKNKCLKYSVIKKLFSPTFIVTLRHIWHGNLFFSDL
jgi:hypothetical protein